MAESQVYYKPGTTLTVKSSGGTAAITPTSLGAGAGRISAQIDRGAGSLPARYKWRAFTKWAASPVIGETLRLYLVTSDGTNVDGNGLGTTDAAVSSENELLYNCQSIGQITAGAAASQTEVASGVIEIYDRYFSIAIWNGSAAKALTSTATDTEIDLTPVPDSIQAAA